MNNLPYIRRQYDFSDCFDLLLSRMKDTPKNSNNLEAGEGYSTASLDIIPPHRLDKVKPFLHLVKEVCENVYGRDFTEEELDHTITRSWTNKHYRTGQSLEHCHDQAELVFACYVSAPENSGHFEMFYNDQWHTIPVKTGDVLIFPGDVLHRSQVSETDDVRLVMTLNLNSSHYPYQLKLREEFNNVGETQQMFVNFMNDVFIEFAESTSNQTKFVHERLLTLE